MPIFDQGYQHWNGRLSGHGGGGWRSRGTGMRTQLKVRYVRLLMIFAWMPAMTLVGVLAVWGLIEQGVGGRDYSLPFFTMLAEPATFTACRQAVWTISYLVFFHGRALFHHAHRDDRRAEPDQPRLRFNALPLYLSRPLTRLDYFFGKLGMIGGMVAVVAVIPAAAAYVLGVCFSLDLSVVRDTWRLLPASIVYGLVIVVSAGTLMLALSSMSRRSLYVGLAWIGLWLISNSVALVLGQIQDRYDSE